LKKYLFLILANSLLISNLSHAKNINHSTGLIFDDNQYEKTPLSTPLLRGQYDNISKHNSLKKYAPKVGNQGEYETCVGWATAYAAKTILYNINNNNTDESIKNNAAFSPSYIYNQISTDPSCHYGTFIDDALNLMTKQGVLQLSDFGYQCGRVVTSGEKIIASFYKIDGFKKLFDLTDSDKINPIRKSLSENKPVVIGMTCCSESFQASLGVDVWNVPSNEPIPNQGHAIAVIGYDDEKYGGAFLIMNSWSEVWGDKGFIWIKYSDFKRFTKYAYEMIEDEKGDKISGSLEFKTINDKTMPTKLDNNLYSMAKSYNSGTLFRLYISNNEPSYIYALGSDLTNNTYKIFPHKDNISAYLGYKNSEFALPDENNYIKMDNTVGTDYFCFLYSKEPININDLRQKIESEEGSFEDKLNKALAGKIIDNKDIVFSKTGKISFSAKSKRNKNILAVIVKMEHI